MNKSCDFSHPPENKVLNPVLNKSCDLNHPSVDKILNPVLNKSCDFSHPPVDKILNPVLNKSCDFSHLESKKLYHSRHFIENTKNTTPDDCAFSCIDDLNKSCGFKTNRHYVNNTTFGPKNPKGERKKDRITCFYTNADSLLNKRKELEIEVEINTPDVVAICEVKPKTCRYSVQPGEISLPGYELFHNLEDNGRGVLLLVRNDLNPSVCDALSNTNFQEALFVDCKISEKDTFTIGIVYRSPNSTSENSEKLNSLLQKAVNVCKNLVIVGDFNYPEISWESETCHTRPDHEAAKFLKNCKDSFLSQHQREPTRYRSQVKILIFSILYLQIEMSLLMRYVHRQG